MIEEISLASGDFTVIIVLRMDTTSFQLTRRVKYKALL